jgi:predicted nucleic acid-binding protein
MVAADTNVIVRLITRDDAHQVGRAEAFVAEGVWVSHIVMAEVISVLRRHYGFSHAELADAIELVLAIPSVSLHEGETVRAALSLYRQHPSLGFSDCMILESARKAGHLPLGTFDRTLGRVAGAQRL